MEKTKFDRFMSIKLTKETYEWVSDYAKKHDKKVTEVVREAIHLYKRLNEEISKQKSE